MQRTHPLLSIQQQQPLADSLQASPSTMFPGHHHHHGHGMHQQERVEKLEARIEENMAANAFARGDVASGIALEADAMRHRQNAAVIDDVRHGYVPVPFAPPAVVVQGAYLTPSAPAYGTPVPQGYAPPQPPPLPPGWEELREASGRIYYGNPALRIVQYDRPAYPQQPPNPYGGQQQQQQQYPQQQYQQQQYPPQQQYPQPQQVPSGYPPIPQAIGQTPYGQTAVVYAPTQMMAPNPPMMPGYPPLAVPVVVGGGFGVRGMERREEATAAIENQMAMNALARGDVNSFVALENDAMRHQANASALHQAHHHHHHHHGGF